jgi:hypothetical protein
MEFAVLHSNICTCQQFDNSQSQTKRRTSYGGTRIEFELHDFQGKLSINNNAQACFPSLSLTQAFFVQTHCCFGERITQAKLYLFFRVKFATGLSCRVLCSISRRDLFRTDNIPFGARVFLDSRRPSAFWDLDIRLERRWCTFASRSFLS